MEIAVKMFKVFLPEDTVVYVDGKRICKCLLQSHARKIEGEGDDIHDITWHIVGWHIFNSIIGMKMHNMCFHVI